MVVRGLGLFNSVDDVANTLVKAQNGKTIRVGDMGDVAIGSPERSGMVALNREPDVTEGVVLMIKRQNAAEVVKNVQATVDQLNTQFRLDAKREGRQPIQIRPTYERTKLIDRTVDTVAENLLVGACLVTALLLVFLRNWRAALPVAAIIPLALLAAFAGLYQVSVPANLISMGAVDFGIIIDSAVVLVEALMVTLAVDAARHSGVLTKRQKQMAVRHTVTSLGKPILFSKAIIIMAFVPIFTFQRVEGKMFSPVALTLTFALTAALVLTLTFLPAVLSMLVSRYDMAETHIEWMDKLRARYRSIIAWGRSREKLVFGASAAVLLVTFVLVPQLGSE
jgi:cobalt-zinc-cadmium resistance protein CzcA